MLEKDHGYIKSHSKEVIDENSREEVPLRKVSSHLSLPETMPGSDT